MYFFLPNCFFVSCCILFPAPRQGPPPPALPQSRSFCLVFDYLSSCLSLLYFVRADSSFPRALGSAAFFFFSHVPLNFFRTVITINHQTDWFVYLFHVSTLRVPLSLFFLYMCISCVCFVSFLVCVRACVCLWLCECICMWVSAVSSPAPEFHIHNHDFGGRGGAYVYSRRCELTEFLLNSTDGASRFVFLLSPVTREHMATEFASNAVLFAFCSVVGSLLRDIWHFCVDLFARPPPPLRPSLVFPVAQRVLGRSRMANLIRSHRFQPPCYPSAVSLSFLHSPHKPAHRPCTFSFSSLSFLT